MSVLVAYGVPPNKIKLFSVTGQDLHKTWHFDPHTFKGQVRANFERLLRTALQEFVGSEIPDLAIADFQFTPDLTTLSTALLQRRYTTLVYYGHALTDGVTLLPLHRITARQLASVIGHSGVRHVDILGCNNSAIGALLSTLAPDIVVGTLRGRRFDDIAVDMHTMRLTDFKIAPQAVFHLGPTASPPGQ